MGLNTSFETLFEKLTPNAESKPSIAAECYELVNMLSADEQKALLDIIKKTIEYKRK